MTDEPKLSPSAALRATLAARGLGTLYQSYGDSSHWLTPLNYYVRYLDQDRLFAHCEKRGVEAFLRDGEANEANDEEQSIGRVVAKREIDEGFPVINAYRTAHLWDMFDVTLSDMFALVFALIPDALKAPTLNHVRVSVAEFEELSKAHRMRLVVKELKRELVRKSTAAPKHGVEIYEQILRELAVEGSAPRGFTKLLTELREIRNIVVHNVSIADDYFVKQAL